MFMDLCVCEKEQEWWKHLWTNKKEVEKVCIHFNFLRVKMLCGFICPHYFASSSIFLPLFQLKWLAFNKDKAMKKETVQSHKFVFKFHNIFSHFYCNCKMRLLSHSLTQLHQLWYYESLTFCNFIRFDQNKMYWQKGKKIHICTSNIAEMNWITIIFISFYRLDEHRIHFKPFSRIPRTI